MQLRAARLCLDCEELHTDNSCPRCASESYAFLSGWLPVDERRKWRRPAPTQVVAAPWWSATPASVMKSFGRWLAGEAAPVARTGPMTRAADYASQLQFDTPAHAETREELDIRLSKPGVRKV